MKTGWEARKLGEVCNFEGGSQPPKSEFIYDEKPGYVRFLQIRDFGSDKNITYIRHSKKNRLCKDNDILIGRYGASVGKILTGKAGAYNVALMKTIPNLGVLEKSWFYYFLISDKFQVPTRNIAERSAQAGFSKEDIFNFIVPVPPLPDQRRIVAILDEAFEGIAAAKANAEKNLQNAKGISESHLDALFREHSAGPTQLLKTIASTQYGYTESASGEAVGPRFLRITDIQNGTVDWETVPYCRIDAADLPDYLLRDGDIVFARTGATTGKSYLVRSPPQSVFASYLIRLRPTSLEVIPDYLACFFMTKGYWEAIRAGSTGSAQGGFNATKLGCLQVPVPALTEQRRIVASAKRLGDQSEKFVEKLSQKVETLDELKASLLHQAFTGQL